MNVITIKATLWLLNILVKGLCVARFYRNLIIYIYIYIFFFFEKKITKKIIIIKKWIMSF